MERLGILDAEFLHLEDDCSPMSVAILCIFEGPVPSREEVKRHVAAKLSLVPRYRRRVRFLPFEIGRPVWVDDPHFDLDYHVRRTALPAPGDDSAMGALVGRLMSQLLDRSRPLWEMWIVEGLAGGRWAIISKVHHSMVDGLSGVDLHGLLFDGEPAQPLPEAAPWTPAPEPSRSAMVLDAWRGLAEDAARLGRGALSAARHPAAAARELGDLAAGVGAFFGRFLDLRSGALQGKVGRSRSFAHVSASLADVQAIRRALGGTVNDVVLAAVSGGYRALLLERGEIPEAARLRSLVPVSVRGADERDVLHNRVSALLCDLPVHLADAGERLQAVREQMAALKASHMAEAGAWVVGLGDLAPPFVVGTLTRLLARAMHQVPQRSLATVTTNIPGPQRPLYFRGRRMLDWYPYVPISQGVRVTTAILSYAGRLGYGITSDYDSVRDAGVLARGILQSTTELLVLAKKTTQRAAP